MDASRGYAILTTVLSGSVAWGVLLGWMYHAQVGPRSNFVFDGSIYGITWVDLAFPFFLFVMGAAFPFSISNKYRKGSSRRRTIHDSPLRGSRLTFFATSIQHIYPWVVSSPQDVCSWLIVLGDFALMFPMLMRIPFKMSEYVRMLVKILAYATGMFTLLSINYADGRTFSLGYSNIIILVLANMAIFGSLIYVLTINEPWIRIATLPSIMVMLLGDENAESWNHSLTALSLLSWMYKCSYLKHLLVVIPDSIAGEHLHEWLHCRSTMSVNDDKDEHKRMPWILLLTIGLIVFNLYGLYMRYLILNSVGTIAILCVLYILLQVEGKNTGYWCKSFRAEIYLILPGLALGAYEGGIRKDPSTYSYYSLAPGLVFMAMITFSIMCDIYSRSRLTRPLEYAGQNPMIVYASTQSIALLLLNLAGLGIYLSYLDQNTWLGFLRGVITTSLASLITILFTKLKCPWRTRIMLIKRLYSITTALPVFFICSCGESYSDHLWEWDQETEEEESNLDIVSQEQTIADNLGSLPDYIHICKSPENLAGKKVIVYIAVAGMSKAKFEILSDIVFSQEVNGHGGKPIHIPSEFYESPKAPVVINGGSFFYSAGLYYSQNLVIREGQLLAPNQDYYSKDWVTMWCPTLGAFCQMRDGTFQTTWTYQASDGTNYCYPIPANDDISKDPLQAPSSIFPNGVKVLEVTIDIGGVTVLLRVEEIKNTYVEEILDISTASNQPCTAIDITTNKKMITFVCEGRNMTEGVAGLTTANVAKAVKDLGCTEALNLGGGGSSCMLVNGRETIEGSDGKQRKMLTVVGIKQVMKQFFSFTMLCLLGTQLQAQQMTYHDASYFPFLGKAIQDIGVRYERLLDSFENISRPSLWNLSRNPAEMAIRFRSDSTRITLKWESLFNNHMNHMTDVGIKGLDSYCWEEDGQWRFVNSARPNGKANQAIVTANMQPKEREYILYLPPHDRLVLLSIGVDSLSSIDQPQTDYPIHEKPIAFCGVSAL